MAERYGADKVAMLWSMGKDSTTLLWLARKAFLGALPFPVVHLDTGCKFEAMYAYREQWAREWGLDLRIVRNQTALDAGMGPHKGKLACCGALKTDTFKHAITDLGLKAVYLAIRRDEHGVRAKERFVSPRAADFKWQYQDQPLELFDQYADAPAEEGGHVRVHPILDWSELDVWEYIRAEKIPVIDLYFAKDGKRYRSIGCRPCTSPIASDAADLDKVIAELQASPAGERDGRAQDKEDEAAMQKLRALGYM